MRVFTLLAVLLLGNGSNDLPKPETVTVRGEVVLLIDLLEGYGITTPQDPIAQQVVLRQDDESIIPLLYGVGSRALFEDDRLRNRSTEIVARRYKGLPYLQVLSFKVTDERGEFRTPEYYCDICTIATRYDQACPCCQGAMVLRHRPTD